MNRLLLLGLAGVWFSAVAPQCSGGETPRLIGEFKGVAHIQDMALSPCQKFLAVAGYEDGPKDRPALLIVWDLAAKKEVLRRGGFRGGYGTVAFSPDGKQLAASAFSATAFNETKKKRAKVWRFPSGEEIAEIHHVRPFDSIRFSPDGRYLAATALVPDDDFAVFVWETGKFRELAVLKGPETSNFHLAFSADGKYLANGDAAGQVHFWNLDTMHKVGSVFTHLRPWALAFAGKTNLLAVGGEGGQVFLIRDFNKVTKLEPKLKGERAVLFSLVFSSDDRWLFAGGYPRLMNKKYQDPGTLQVWNVKERKLHATLFDDLDYYLLKLAVTRDGRMLIAGCTDATVRVWSLPKEYHVRSSKTP